MKLIVDIPNGLYPNLGKIQNGSIASKRILDCVRNGTVIHKDYVVVHKDSFEGMEGKQNE